MVITMRQFFGRGEEIIGPANGTASKIDQFLELFILEYEDGQISLSCNLQHIVPRLAPAKEWPHLHVLKYGRVFLLFGIFGFPDCRLKGGFQD